MSTAHTLPVGSLLPVPSGASVHVHRVGGRGDIVLNTPVAHVTIVAEPGSEGVCIVDAGEARSVACEVFLGQHSRVTMVMVTPSGAQDISLSQRTSIAEGARLHLLNLSLGRRVSHELESRIVGRGGVSSVDWIAYAKDDERQTFSVRNVFDAPSGGGEVTMRVVAEGCAAVDGNGMIDIGSAGGGTHTYLTQQVLMLDPTAKVDMSPALEIKTNDVKASHSASVSRVTPEDLYYFAARGIDPTAARGLLIRGFLGELVRNIPHPEAVGIILQAIERKYLH